MAGNDGAGSIHGVVLRVSQLNAAGVPATGLGMYVGNQLVKFDYNAEMDTGPEIADRNAAGILAVTYKMTDAMKRLTTTLEIMLPDPELEVMLTGGTTFVSGANVVGMQYPSVGVDPVPNGVGIEIWTRAVKNGYQVSDFPWFHWVWPRVYLHKSNRTIDSNRLASPFDGFATENPNFGQGPAHDIPYDTSKTAQWYRDSTAPTPVIGAQKIP